MTNRIKLMGRQRGNGYWDEGTKQFKIRAATLHPTRQQYCFSLDEIHNEIHRQVV